VNPANQNKMLNHGGFPKELFYLDLNTEYAKTGQICVQFSNGLQFEIQIRIQMLSKLGRYMVFNEPGPVISNYSISGPET
jgi:hypothetical protein